MNEGTGTQAALEASQATLSEVTKKHEAARAALNSLRTVRAEDHKDVESFRKAKDAAQAAQDSAQVEEAFWRGQLETAKAEFDRAERAAWHAELSCAVVGRDAALEALRAICSRVQLDPLRETIALVRSLQAGIDEAVRALESKGERVARPKDDDLAQLAINKTEQDLSRPARQCERSRRS